jgi:hypothetical protein
MTRYQHFPLSSAYLCVSCGEVGSNSRACACCGWPALISLSRILNRTEEQADAVFAHTCGIALAEREW